MTQFDKSTDANLNAYDRLIAKAIEEKEEAERKFNEYWLAVFTVFDRATGRPGKPARFICDSGYTLSREVTAPEPRIEGQAMQQVLAMNHTPTDAMRIWNSITDAQVTRVLNQSKLAKAIKQGKIELALVEKAMATPKPVTSRHRRKTTKDDQLILAKETAAEEQAVSA